MIERKLDERTWYVLPGGGVEDGETIEAAAVREAHEELGVHVELTGLLAEVRFMKGGRLSLQSYFGATIEAGHFGSGDGAEYELPLDSTRGTYQPRWLFLADALQRDVRPRALFSALRDRGVASLMRAPLVVDETG